VDKVFIITAGIVGTIITLAGYGAITLPRDIARHIRQKREEDARIEKLKKEIK
jgi:hypothetical protein